MQACLTWYAATCLHSRESTALIMPFLQDAAPEVYETPDLADDVSTVPTGTVRTISPTPSSDDDHRPGLDRQPLDRDTARRRFETSRIDAKDVDFSDTIAGTRRAYRTQGSRRRRKRIQENGEEEVGDLSESEDETLGTKLARLKREAEEVRMELERREREKDVDGDPKVPVNGQQQREENEDADGVQELSRTLDQLSTKARLKTNGSVEADFILRLSSSTTQGRQQQQHKRESGPSPSLDNTAPPPTLSAVADFSDRLTALESALGLSSTTSTSQTAAILPRLASLSTQITTLSATLASPSISTSGPQNTTPHLDTIATKLKLLLAESERLTQSRKAAIVSLTDLHEKRMQHLASGVSVHASSRPSRLRGLSSTNEPSHDQDGNVLDSQREEDATTDGPGAESLKIQSQVFLDDQASKITALYHLLPTIRDLQPLLPVVLERLRALSVLHNGAAGAKGLVEDLEGRQREMKEEVGRWRDAVERVEMGMKEAGAVMRENVDVLGGRVREVEGRVEQLGGR